MSVFLFHDTQIVALEQCCAGDFSNSVRMLCLDIIIVVEQPWPNFSPKFFDDEGPYAEFKEECAR